MTTVQNGKLYDSKKMEELTSRDRHNNGNYSGTTSLMRASDGTLWEHTYSNGQDLYLRDCLSAFEGDIDSYNPTDEQIPRLAQLGLITIVD